MLDCVQHNLWVVITSMYYHVACTIKYPSRHILINWLYLRNNMWSKGDQWDNVHIPPSSADVSKHRDASWREVTIYLFLFSLFLFFYWITWKINWIVCKLWVMCKEIPTLMELLLCVVINILSCLSRLTEWWLLFITSWSDICHFLF